jgi:hypothetical protein
VYTHTQVITSSSFTIAGGGVFTPAFTSKHVANAVISEISGCPFGGVQHVHQYNTANANGLQWYHNTNGYPNAVNPGNWDPFNINYWQAKVSWTE